MSASETARTVQTKASRISGEARVLLHLAIFLAGLLILYSRRPDVLANAQFYAEDGERWYRGAYEFGWRCLLIPDVGYLQTVSRLVALFALLFPFSVAPLVMNACALVAQILPVNWFLSRRFDDVPIAARLLACGLY